MIDFYLNAPSFIALLIYSLAIIILYKPNIIISSSMILCNFLPFLLNDFLFPIEYFSDQLRYLDCTIEIRKTLSCEDIVDIYAESSIIPSGLEFASYIFSFFPVPVVSSVFSIAIINRFIFLMLIHFLLSRKNNYQSIATVISIMPSAIFYSSIALRDNLILFLLMIFIVLIYERKFFVTLMIIPLMTIIKLPIALSMAAIYIYFLFSPQDYKKLKIYSLSSAVMIFVIFNVTLLSISDIFFEFFNRYQNAMASDAGINSPDPIYGIGSFYAQLPTSVIEFFYSPSIFDVTNFFKLLSFIENNIFLILIVYFLMRSSNIFNPTLLYPALILIGIGTIFAVIVFNDGTLTRYIYPIKISLISIIFLSSQLYNTTKQTKTYI